MTRDDLKAAIRTAINSGSVRGGNMGEAVEEILESVDEYAAELRDENIALRDRLSEEQGLDPAG